MFDDGDVRHLIIVIKKVRRKPINVYVVVLKDDGVNERVNRGKAFSENIHNGIGNNSIVFLSLLVYLDFILLFKMKMFLVINLLYGSSKL